MKIHFAKITFHNWKDITTIYEDEWKSKILENSLSSDSRFIKIEWNLYAISSIASVIFWSKEKEKKPYEELSEENKKEYDRNKNAFPMYEIIKSLII
jgi:hypothetical protein